MVGLKGIAGFGFSGSRVEARCALGLSARVETMTTCCWCCFLSREAAMHAVDHCIFRLYTQSVRVLVVLCVLFAAANNQGKGGRGKVVQ